MQTKVWLKRITFLVLIALVFISARLYDNGLCSVIRAGEFSYFNERDEEIYCPQPLFCRYAYQKIELDRKEAKEVLEPLMIEVVTTENFDTVCVFYGRTPFIYNSIEIDGNKVNIMIAVREDKVLVGSPVLKGSF